MSISDRTRDCSRAFCREACSFLSPELFISYGRSLFGEGGLFLLRYRLSKHWEIETQTGEEMGGDIYYKLDFK